MRLIPVTPENLKLAWKDVGKYVEQGLEYTDGKYAVNDVRALLGEGLLILWVVYNEEKEKAIGCLLTEVLQYPRVKSLSIFLLGGDDFPQIVEVLEDLKNYARSIECKTIEFYGRAGWEKVLKPYDFEKTHIVMRLDL